jgi:hypothetical protein
MGSDGMFWLKAGLVGAAIGFWRGSGSRVADSVAVFARCALVDGRYSRNCSGINGGVGVYCSRVLSVVCCLLCGSNSQLSSAVQCMAIVCGTMS